MDYSTCLPTRLNPLAERTCFSQAPDATYSHADLQRIVSYARDRGIRVVPEIEMPGHAAIWGVAYPNTTITCPEGAGPGYQTLLNPTAASSTASLTSC